MFTHRNTNLFLIIQKNPAPQIAEIFKWKNNIISAYVTTSYYRANMLFLVNIYNCATSLHGKSCAAAKGETTIAPEVFQNTW